MKMFQRILLAGMSLLLLASVPLGVQATESVFKDAQGNLKNTSGKAGLGDPTSTQARTTNLISDFINFAVGVLGVIAVILIIYAGGLWLTAAGNDDKVNTAKKIIRSTIVGILIVGFAYAITAFVLGLVLQRVTKEKPKEDDKKGSYHRQLTDYHRFA